MLHRLQTVSYTHLDVYKRQPYTKNGLKKGTYFVSVKNSIKFTGVDTPVSYTHLDVYKRQVMRHIPIFTFINKMDRDANDTFEPVSYTHLWTPRQGDIEPGRRVSTGSSGIEVLTA